MPQKELVSLENVSFVYPGSNKYVIKNVSFGIRKKEILGITGASGTGKSTLLRLFAGTIVPSIGLIERGHIKPTMCAFAPQADILLEYRTVYENAALLLERHNFLGSNYPAYSQKITELLKLLHLTPNTDDLPASLSGGMRQRVQFIQAIIPEVTMRLFDEPFSQQDKDNQGHMEDIIFSADKGRDCVSIIVSHDIDALAAVCDRVLILAGTPASIINIVEAPDIIVENGGNARRTMPDFQEYNSLLWAARARGSLI